jgi:hypothetical protein
MSTPVRASNPITFSLLNNDAQPVLDILDSSEGQDLTLEINNSSGRDLRLSDIGQGNAGTDSHHFELRFRPGVLKDAAGITASGEGGWQIGKASQADGTVSLYLSGANGGALAAGETLSLSLGHVNADGGGGARGTKVELKYQKLEYTSSDPAKKPEPLAEGYRVQYLSIVNQRGRKYIPLHVGFVGSNTILNDGKTSNDRVLSITNTLEDEKLPLSANPLSRFILSFDVYDPKEQNDWALGTSSAVKSIEVDAVQKSELTLEQMQARLNKAKESLWQQLSPEQQNQEQQNLAALNSDSERVNYLIDKFRVHIESDELETLDEWKVEKNDQGTTVEWIITPAKDKSFLDEGESLCLRMRNVVSAMRSGPANVYLRYENIPGYWDGQFVTSLEKTHLIQRDQLSADESYTQESYVGIGTNDPHTSLVIKKSAGGALGPILTLQNDGGWAGAGGAIDFNGYVVGANEATARVRSLDDGDYSSHLAFYSKEPGAVGKRLQERLRISSNGNVGIGTTDPKGKLHVAGDALFDGKVGIATGDPQSKLHVSGDSQLDGNVGIGKAPDSKVMLDVAGDIQIPERGRINLNGEQHGLMYRHFKDEEIDGPILYGWSGGALASYRPENAGRKIILRWNDSGQVGIGTTKPLSTLSISEVSEQGLRDGGQLIGELSFVGFNRPQASSSILAQSPGWDDASHLIFKTSNGSGSGGLQDRMCISSEGNVGIGTDSPGKGKLEINGTASGDKPGFSFKKWLNIDGLHTGGNPNQPLSMYADSDIAASALFVFSDERIKNIRGRSDGARDLETLLGIEITDYDYIDVIGKRGGPHKKVIGQQVERVFPQAVSRLTDVVPDIYQPASFKDGWVELATDLKKGERVRLISERAEGVYEVLEVAQDKFRADFKPEGDRVFVFGREVNDYRTVDYDAISMLNVSATQQLKKEKDEEVKSLRAELAELKATNEALEKRLRLLESKLAGEPNVVVAKNGSGGNGKH